MKFRYKAQKSVVGCWRVLDTKAPVGGEPVLAYFNTRKEARDLAAQMNNYEWANNNGQLSLAV